MDLNKPNKEGKTKFNLSKSSNEENTDVNSNSNINENLPKKSFNLSKSNPEEQKTTEMGKNPEVVKKGFNLSKSDQTNENTDSGKKSTPEIKKPDNIKAKYPTTQVETKKSKSWIFILLAVIAIIIVIVVYMNNNKPNNQKAINDKPATETPNNNATNVSDTTAAITPTNNNTQNPEAVTNNTTPNNATANTAATTKFVKGKTYDVYHFATGSPEIVGSDSKLDEMYTYMKDNPKASVQITGYTDNVGSAEFNLSLSKKRAAAIYNYLLSKGIVSDRLKYTGKGLENPVGDNNSEEGRLTNRRAEFEITN